MEATSLMRSGSTRLGAAVPRLRRCGTARLSMSQLEVKPRANLPLRRAISDADMVGSVCRHGPDSVTAVRPPRIASEVKPVDDVSGGAGMGRKVGGGGNGNRGRGEGSRGGGGEKGSGMREYYEKMLRSEPGNALLLRNYGEYLHEVEGDLAKAEECYSRAILACPGDGEVLSLYARLLWESRGEKERAEGYFERAVEASPDDCFVMGSYASFLWDTEEDEEQQGDVTTKCTGTASASATPAPLVRAC